MAATCALGAHAARRGGSSPSIPTIFRFSCAILDTHGYCMVGRI